MRNLLTINIETRTGVVVILLWATLFCIIVFSATANFEKFLARLDMEAQTTTVIYPKRDMLRGE